jgi:hypothetical protein
LHAQEALGVRRVILFVNMLALAGTARADFPVRILSSHRAGDCSVSMACFFGPGEDQDSESSDSPGSFESHLRSITQNFMCQVAAMASSDQLSEIRPESIAGTGSIQVSAVAGEPGSTAEAQSASVLDVTFSVDATVAFQLQGEISAQGTTSPVDAVEILVASAVDTVLAIRARCDPDPTYCTITRPFDITGVLHPGEYRLRTQAAADLRAPYTAGHHSLAWSVRLAMNPVVPVLPNSWTSIKRIYREATP